MGCEEKEMLQSNSNISSNYLDSLFEVVAMSVQNGYYHVGRFIPSVYCVKWCMMNL